MIELFHGSNVYISEIDLSKGLANKDFGRGFYLTDIYEQAMSMAQRRVRLMDGMGCPTVTRFLFDESCLNSGLLKTLFFDNASAEWAEFITKNRMATRNGYVHDYDIVYGPVANDGVYDQLRRYMRGTITASQLAEELKYTKLNNQYFFGSKEAIKYLIPRD